MRYTITFSLRLFIVAVAFIAPLAVSAQLTVTSLTVEHMKNLSTVDVPAPRLSWINEVKDTKVRGERQTAYRIVVASSVEKLKAEDYDMWDSGKILSEQSTLIPYGGRQLTSGAGLLLESADMECQEEGVGMERNRLLGHGTADCVKVEVCQGKYTFILE